MRITAVWSPREGQGVDVTRRSTGWAIRALIAGTLLVGAAAPALAQLPAPWTNRDIGAPSVAGSAAESAGNYTVRGAGIDIWGSSDQFHFVYQQITGDVDVRARVAGVEYVHRWTKGGVMIRETLNPGSRNASMFVSPANGLAFQRRVQSDGVSTYTSGGLVTAPYWVRLVRFGQLFRSYVSADGTSWTLVGSETIAMAATAYVGLGVTSHDASRAAMVTFTDVTITGSGIPPPPSGWTNTDVGGPALAGRGSQSNGTFSVTGAGKDIWGGADQFHFMHQRADGDIEVVARLVNVEKAHDWSKAGVMIRESLSGSAANAFMAGTAAKGWDFQRRPASGGLSVYTPGTFSSPPGWIRLVRAGHTFSAYESTDGSNWALIGTETIPMPQSVYVGLAVTSHNAGMTATATFTSVAIRGPAPSNQRPTVTLTAPATSTTYTAPATITFAATASDADGTVSRVDFYANGQQVGSDTSSPYGATWNNVPQGTFNLTAVATDNAGATTTSATATVTVNAASNQPPTSAITSPANGAPYTAPATIAINASASDSNGTVTKVDFYGGSTRIGSDTTSPYSVIWSNVAAGSYALTAVAFDNAGASTASAAVNVTVNTAGPTPTRVEFNPSPDHANGVTSYSVAIRRAGDPVTATPVATKNLGKPAPVNNVITSDISDIVNPLPAGSYYAVVTATGPGGSGASTPSATFTR